MKKLLVLLMFFPTFFIGQIKDTDSLQILHNNKGNSFARENKFQEAIIEYNKAINIDSNYAMAYINRGVARLKEFDDFTKAYEKVGLENEAINDFTKAIEINPRAIDTCIKLNVLPNVYFFRGEVYLNQKKHKEAIADFNIAIDLNPNYTDAYFKRGLVYSLSGNYKNAIADFTRAIDLNPNYTDAYYNRGHNYNYLENYEDAIADFTKAIKIDPDYTYAYIARGSAYSFLEKHNEAFDDFNKAIELNPTDAIAYLCRGLLKKEKGLEYCDDYKTACYLGLEQACQWYNGQCK